MTATESDRAALYAGILADPEDDGPRLVYADWLEENGEPELAEFIRVQVELAKLIPTLTEWSYELSSRVDALRRREGELSKTLLHYRSMAAGQYTVALTAGYSALERPIYKLFPPGGGPEIANVDFRRGFVAHVTLTAERWLAHADQLLWRPGEPCRFMGPNAHHSRDCSQCGGSKHRPMPPSACPLEEVTLVTFPTYEWSAANWDIASDIGDLGEQNRERYIADVALSQKWPGITFHLPGDQP